MKLHPRYLAMKKEYIQGWHTWNVRSVLSHVHMPDGLALNLAVKEYKSGRYLKETLIGRHGDRDEKVLPGAHAYDESYTSLRIQWMEMEFLVETSVENDDLLMLVTPVKTQKIPAMLVLETGFLWNRPGTFEHAGSDLLARSGNREVFIRTTGKAARPDTFVATQAPYLACEMNGPVAFYTGRTRTVEEIRGILDRKQAALSACWRRYGTSSEMYEALQSVIAWNTIYDPVHDRVITPVSRIWNLDNGGYVLFCWDNYFVGYMASLENKELAYSNLIEITSERTRNGFIPNFSCATGLKSVDRSQPPVGSTMLLETYRRYGEPWIVEYLYPVLFRWNTWYFKNRMAESGALCWGSNPYESSHKNYTKTTSKTGVYRAALESGLDNSPMYDNIPFDNRKHTYKLEDVGLTGMYILDCRSLIELAEILRRREDAVELARRKEMAETGLMGLWDDEKGFFFNRRTDTGQFDRHISPCQFYALFSDQVTWRQVSRIIGEHYYNPSEFYGDWMLPSISRDDPAFTDQNYWRGRVWAPLNFLTYLAFLHHDLPDARHDLACKSRDILMKEWREHRHIHENYNAMTGEGCDAKNSDRFYHWSALLAVISMLDEGCIEGFGNKQV